MITHYLVVDRTQLEKKMISLEPFWVNILITFPRTAKCVKLSTVLSDCIGGVSKGVLHR